MNIDLKQPSTLRGLVWLATAIIGAGLVLTGQDVTQLLLLASGVAGGLGVALKD